MKRITALGCVISTLALSLPAAAAEEAPTTVSISFSGDVLAHNSLYWAAETAGCENGKVLIYGEMGGRPPEIITCPQCNGVGKIQVSREYVQEQIDDLVDEREEINERIKTLQSYLK